MLFDGHRKVGAALHRGIISDDDTLLALNNADAGHDTSRGSLIFIHIPGGQRAEFQKGSIGVAEQLDTLAGQQFVTLAMSGDSILSSPQLNLLDALLQLVEKLLSILGILLKFGIG